MRRNVLDKNRMIIGFLDIDENFINAFSIKKGWVGRYSKNIDMTFDENGRMYTFGDATETLIRNAEDEI